MASASQRPGHTLALRTSGAVRLGGTGQVTDAEVLQRLFDVLEELERLEYALDQDDAPSWQTRELSRIRDRLREARIALGKR